MKKVLLALMVLMLLVLAFNLSGWGDSDASKPEQAAVDTLENEAPQEVEEEQEELGLTFSSPTLLQGSPGWIRIDGLGTSTVRSLVWNGKSLGVFEHEGKPHALIAADLREKPGAYPATLTLEDGRTVRESISVTARVIETAPLGIPEKLGGNTSESEQELVSTLVEEGRIISSIPTSAEKLWGGSFRLPINPPITITDTYGYSRQTGGSQISHKGTDFRAAVGTPVYAMNSGLVRFTDYMRNYGHTVVIDHGFGLHTIYMHLSEIRVSEGETVEKGDLIALSGDTGYTLGPHLHLTVRIGGISIDPQVFIALFGE